MSVFLITMQGESGKGSAYATLHSSLAWEEIHPNAVTAGGVWDGGRHSPSSIVIHPMNGLILESEVVRPEDNH